MKGDFSRLTFDAGKNYTGVLRQQGRVDLDADSNENEAIHAHLREQALADVLGPAGAPGNGFAVTVEAAGENLRISAGRCYVDGVMVDNAQDVLYQGTEAENEVVQPNGVLDGEELAPPDPGTAPLPDLEVGTLTGARRLRTDLVYLQTWQRHVTALEDPSLREVALGGPDTTTRLQTTWRVRVRRAVEAAHCHDHIAGFPPEPTGTGRLTTSHDVAAPPPNHCAPEPDRGGYRGGGNHLFRVEVHTGGSHEDATYKWSSENATTVHAVESVDGAHALTLRQPALDDELGIHEGDAVEVYSAQDVRQSRSGLLTSVIGPPDGLELTLAADISHYLGPSDVAVRRWDAEARPVSGGGTLGDSGIAVEFSTGTYTPGDYWLLPARVRDPDHHALTAAAPHGTINRHARLGLLHWWRAEDGSVVASFQDCRPVFPPATELTTLQYVGGAGQEAMPDRMLAHPLQVRVLRGGRPVADTPVRFAAESGTLTGPDLKGYVLTDSHGLAEVSWRLPSRPGGAQPLSLRVAATVLGEPHLQVVFTADFSVADDISYRPAEECDLSATTVQTALDELCARGVRREPGVHVTGVYWGADLDLDDHRHPRSPSRQRYEPVETDGRITGLRLPPSENRADALARLRQEADARDMPYLAAAHLEGDVVVLAGTRRGAKRVGAEMARLLASDRDHVDLRPVRNDARIHLGTFIDGLTIQCDRELHTDVSRATCFLTLEAPLLETRTYLDRAGYLPVVLRPAVASQDDVRHSYPHVAGSTISWRPAADVEQVLLTACAQAAGYGENTVLVRMTLKGNFVRDAWCGLYLDGNGFGAPRTAPHDMLPLPGEHGHVYSGDGVRGGDFEMWFWVQADPPMGFDQDDIGFIMHRNRSWCRFDPLLSMTLNRDLYQQSGLLPEGYRVHSEYTYAPEEAEEWLKDQGLSHLPLGDDVAGAGWPLLLLPSSMGPLYKDWVDRDWNGLLQGTLPTDVADDDDFVETVRQAKEPPVLLFCRRSHLDQLLALGVDAYDPVAFVPL